MGSLWTPQEKKRKKEKKSTFHLLATEASGGDKRRSTFSTSRCHYAWKQQRRSRFIFEKTNVLTKLALRRSGMTSWCLLSGVCVTGRVEGKRPLSKRWQRRNIWNWWRRAKSNKCFSAYPPVAHVARTQSVQLTQQRVRDEKLQFPMNQFHMVWMGQQNRKDMKHTCSRWVPNPGNLMSIKAELKDGKCVVKIQMDDYSKQRVWFQHNCPLHIWHSTSSSFHLLFL